MMVAQRLDGKECAADLEVDLLARISSCPVRPHLAVIIVGDDAASKVYVANKIKTCERLGITSTHISLSTDSAEEELRKIIFELNHDESLLLCGIFHEEIAIFDLKTNRSLFEI